MASDKKETVTQEKIIWSLTDDAEKELEEMMDSLMHKIEKVANREKGGDDIWQNAKNYRLGISSQRKAKSR